MSRYEITQAQWKAVTNTEQSHFRGEDLPAENVSWDDVQIFIRELNGHGEEMFRLPTEAEWEYACRAGGNSTYGVGESPQRLGEVAWFEGSETHKVGQNTPNAWGLYDMQGNVWEWCADWYGPYPQRTVTDPQGPEASTHRIMRGGSIGTPPEECRPAFRRSASADFRNYKAGFRLAR